MKNLDEEIGQLEELKKAWNEKYSELLKFVKTYKGGSDDEYIAEFQKKLNAISDELKAIGKEYHQEVEKVADDITSEYKDNPIIQNLVEGVKSDVDDNWHIYIR
jgi:uncharacterized coiled-coil DUF342 family protein